MGASTTAALASATFAYLCYSEHNSPTLQTPVFGSRKVPASWRASADAAYLDRSLLDLINSYFVFKICQMETLVGITPKILKFAEAIHVDRPMYWIVKHTFFHHFCGGEDAPEVVPSMEKLKMSGVGSIVDLSIEADVESSGTEPTVDELIQYSSKVTELLKESIDIAAVEPDSFIAVKLTGIAPPHLLKKMTDAFVKIKTLFSAADSDRDGKISLIEFKAIVQNLPSSSALTSKQVDDLFTSADLDKDGRLDWVDVSDIFSFSNPTCRSLFSSPSAFNQSDVKLFDSAMDHLHSLCTYASKKQVRIMIDAEQSYFQPAIDDMAISLSKYYNRSQSSPSPADSRGVIFNTYQLYLKDAADRVQLDYARAQRHNYAFCAKLVRGAYMLSERRRAQEQNYPDPIHGSIQDTHTAYNTSVDFLLSRLKAYKDSPQSQSRGWFSSTSSSYKTPISLVVASHNKDSILSTIQKMSDLGLAPGDGVYFAQLMGMQDSVTFGLAANGYKSYKYLPYGPVNKVFLLFLQNEASSIKKTKQ